MLSPYSLSRPGGVQGQVLGLARALRGLGHQVTVVGPDELGENEPAGRGAGPDPVDGVGGRANRTCS